MILVGEGGWQLVRKHIATERIALAAKLEVLEDELDGCQKRKLWLDWIRRFQKRVATSDLSTEQRREFLTGVLESIDVYLDDPKTHRLRLNFKMEIVGEDRLPASSQGLVTRVRHFSPIFTRFQGKTAA